jgi:L-threonylcarbamoyladenylate synthase
MDFDNENLIDVLKRGGVAVIPTDTLYGVVGSALNKATVERIYNLKSRTLKKPCIILIGDISQLENFYIILSEEQKNKIKEFWPGPVSIILDCPSDSLSYLHRDTKTLAFRFPIKNILRELLLEVGPLVAPSANPEGLPTAGDISKAKEYFGNAVDLYIDGGKIVGKASKLIKLQKDGAITIIRE